MTGKEHIRLQDERLISPEGTKGGRKNPSPALFVQWLVY